jgi:hypothetical protein
VIQVPNGMSVGASTICSASSGEGTHTCASNSDDGTITATMSEDVET